MSKVFSVLGIALAVALGVAGCGSTGETVGTAGGAVAGGAIGSAVTGGSTIGTVGGAVAGGVIGHEAGQAYQFDVEFLAFDNDGNIAYCPYSWSRFARFCLFFASRAP